MAPNQFCRRKNGPAAKHTGGIHFHHVLASHCQHVSGDEKNVAGTVVATGELASEGFGLAGVGQLKPAQSFLAGNSVIEKKRSSTGFFDFAKLSPPGNDGRWERGWLGTTFEVAHQFGIDRERKVELNGHIGPDVGAFPDSAEDFRARFSTERIAPQDLHRRRGHIEPQMENAVIGEQSIAYVRGTDGGQNAANGRNDRSGQA